MAADHGLSFRIEQFGAVASTQQLVRDRIAAGEAVHGVVVRAREQTRGRGRHGRHFVALPGGSYQSLAIGGDAVGLDWADGSGPSPALALGVGIAETLGRYGARVQLKWPNDLYYAGKKLGGILAEVVRGYLLVGVGVNVDNDVPAGATGLRGWDIDGVHGAVLAGIEAGLALLRAGEGLDGRYAPFDCLVGRRVVVELGPGERVAGVVAGIDARGGLRLCASGEVVLIERGSVVEIK